MCGHTQANLVHDSDASVLALLVKLLYGRGDVASSHNMLLLSDGSLDDSGVVGVGDQADDQVVLGELLVQGLVTGSIEGDGDGVLDAGRQNLCGFESPASCNGIFQRAFSRVCDTWTVLCNAYRQSR